MKKIYALLGAVTLLMGAKSAQAQNYLPFQPNQTYHFSDVNQDSIYSLKVNSVTTAGTDSAFHLNKNVRKGFFNVTDCQNNNVFLMHLIEDNMFGNRMVKKANGDLLFLSSATDTFTLKTKAQVNQSWTFQNNSTLTATLTNRGVETFSGKTDSVITYTISNGKTIKLSKNYGFIKVHPFKPYYNTNALDKEWELFALPEKGIGKQTLNALTIFDYQPGDSLGWHQQSYDRNNQLCSDRWLRKVILSRATSSGQDTVWYEVERQILQKYTFPTSDPMGCMGGSTSFVHDTVTEMYTDNSNSRVNLLTNSWGQGSYRINLNLGTYRSNIQNKYLSIFEGEYLRYDTCAGQLRVMPDAYNRRSYLEGAGLLEERIPDFHSWSVDSLEFYRKSNNQNFGNYTPLSVLASFKKPVLATSIIAYPNPFISALTLELDNLKPAEVTIAIYNQLGQQVHVQQLFLVQGKQNVNILLPDLAKGMYMLQLSNRETTQAMRIIKQ